MNIYVGNIPFQATEEEIRSAFEAYGEVESVRIISDRDTGRSKGFGFVEMSNDEQAQAAINALNGSEMGGRNLIINEARPRNERGGGGFGGRGGRGRGGYNRF